MNKIVELEIRMMENELAEILDEDFPAKNMRRKSRMDEKEIAVIRRDAIRNAKKMMRKDHVKDAMYVSGLRIKPETKKREAKRNEE